MSTPIQFSNPTPTPHPDTRSSISNPQRELSIEILKHLLPIKNPTETDRFSRRLEIDGQQLPHQSTLRTLQNLNKCFPGSAIQIETAKTRLHVQRSSNNNTKVVKTLLELCALEIRANHLNSAINTYEEALRHCQEFSPELLKDEAISEIFEATLKNLYDLRRKRKEALTEAELNWIEPLEHILKIRAELQKVPWGADSDFWMDISFLYTLKQERSKAIEAATYGLTILELPFMPDLETAKYYNYFGELLSSEDEKREALTAHLHAIEILDQIKNHQGINHEWIELNARSHLLAGKKYNSLEEFGKAIECCTSAHTICQNEGIRFFVDIMRDLRVCRSYARDKLSPIIFPYIERATFALGAGHFREALEAYNMALKFFKPSDYVLGEQGHSSFNTKYESAIKFVKEEIQSNLEYCHNLCDNQDWESALLLFIEILKDWHACVPDKGTYRQKFKKIANKMGKAQIAQIAQNSLLEESLKFCITIIENDTIFVETPEAAAEGWCLFASLLLIMCKYDQAIECLNTAKKITNEFAETGIAVVIKNLVNDLLEKASILVLHEKEATAA